MNHIRGKSTIIIISNLHFLTPLQGVAATSCPRGIMRTRTATFSHPNHWEPPTGVFEQSEPIYLVKAIQTTGNRQKVNLNLITICGAFNQLSTCDEQSVLLISTLPVASLLFQTFFQRPHKQEPKLMS